MRNVKKLLSIILIATMILISLVGCGSSDKDSPDVSNNDKQLNGTKTDNKEGESDSKGDADISNYLNTEGFPIVKEPITLKAMVSRTAVQPEYGDMLMWQKYEEMTGIKIEWENVPDESIAEKRNLALASGEYPDVFFRCKFSDNDMSKYGAQGVFIPINAYIDAYAPNLKKAIDSMEDVKKKLT